MKKTNQHAEYQPSPTALKLIEEAYPKVLAFIANKEYQEDGRVSVSLFQRRFRLKYNASKFLMDKLIHDKLVEPFQQWVGSMVNGVRTDGQEITCYRVVQVEAKFTEL